MIRNILLGLFAFVIISVIILWIMNKGPERTWSAVRNFSFINATSSGDFALPWQPTTLIPLVDDEDLFGEKQYDAGENGDVSQQLSDIEKKYADIMKGVEDVRTFGDPSPLFGSVRISPAYSNAAGNTTESEFLLLEASPSNQAPIPLTGWSLQSALTGVRIAIPPAASPLVSGNVNAPSEVLLEPGASSIVSTGESPIGVSFRENVCIGYIARFQDFYPPLPIECPSPSSELPLTALNLKRYGDACFDFVEQVHICEFLSKVPERLSPECRAFLQSALSYNGCVLRHSTEYSFSRNSWRLYLNSPQPLWRDTHDAIRLLDEKGQTVDAYVY